jgi:hypothetical protein
MRALSTLTKFSVGRSTKRKRDSAQLQKTAHRSRKWRDAISLDLPLGHLAARFSSCPRHSRKHSCQRMGRPRMGHPAGFCKDHFPTQAEIQPSRRMDVSPSFPEPEAARRQRPLPRHYLAFQPAVARPFAGIALRPGDSHCNEYSGNKLWVTGSLIHMCYRRAPVVSHQ